MDHLVTEITIKVGGMDRKVMILPHFAAEKWREFVRAGLAAHMPKEEKKTSPESETMDPEKKEPYFSEWYPAFQLEAVAMYIGMDPQGLGNVVTSGELNEAFIQIQEVSHPFMPSGHFRG